MTMAFYDEFDARAENLFPAPWLCGTPGVLDLWRDVSRTVAAFSGLARVSGRRRARRPVRVSRAPSLEALELEVCGEFRRLAASIALSEQEWRALLGEDFSDTVLALELVGVALNLFGDAVATLDWLRAAHAEPPFFGRAPLELIAADGRLGAEIVLIHLRACQRRH